MNPEGGVKRGGYHPRRGACTFVSACMGCCAGQPVVFYWNDLLLGGGIVRKGRNEDFRQLQEM